MRSLKRGVAFNLDRVMRVVRIQVHLEVQRQALDALDRALDALVDAAGLALPDLEEGGAQVAMGDNGSGRLGDSDRFPPQAMGYEGRRFFQTRVAGLAQLEQAAKDLGRLAAADLLLERPAPGRGIDHALHLDGANVAAHERQEEREHVHRRTRD